MVYYVKSVSLRFRLNRFKHSVKWFGRFGLDIIETMIPEQNDILLPKCLQKLHELGNEEQQLEHILDGREKVLRSTKVSSENA